MRTSKVGLLVAGCLILAACGNPFGQSRNVASKIRLPDGTVVAGANGWCIDEATSRAGGATSVVVDLGRNDQVVVCQLTQGT